MQSSSGATKVVNGFLWPAYDDACAAVIFDSLPDLLRAVDQCSTRRTVIQAGGNCGVWARRLADIFSSVWTWEPDATNFHCLEYNTKHLRNVTRVNAALGAASGWALLAEPEKNNCGALQIEPYLSGIEPPQGAVRVDRIDDYGRDKLGAVDLIYLDLEGFELAAIEGASQVIHDCQPIIAVEDKGLSERLGITKGDVLRFIEQTFDYKVCDQYARDYVLRPRNRRV